MVTVTETLSSSIQYLQAESLKNQELQVIFDPQARAEYLDLQLSIDGLSHIKENPEAAYCFISLTNTPSSLKRIVQERQQLLIKILNNAGLTAYDPATAPYSPDTNLTSNPDEVYLVDSSKIAGSRYFVGHNLLPSSGQGIEEEKAKNLIRIPVVLMDRNIRVSRMQPSRSIYLEYFDFQAQRNEFVKVFKFLRQFEPGVGFHRGISVLLGFSKDGAIVNLQDAVYEQFPDLRYTYDGTKPTSQLEIQTPEIFG